jgi:hypothetical protein
MKSVIVNKDSMLYTNCCYGLNILVVKGKSVMRFSKSVSREYNYSAMRMNVQARFDRFSYTSGFLAQEGQKGSRWIEIYEGDTVDGEKGCFAIVDSSKLLKRRMINKHRVNVYIPDSMSRKFKMEIRKGVGMRWWNRRRGEIISEKGMKELAEGKEIEGAYGRTWIKLRNKFQEAI